MNMPTGRKRTTGNISLANIGTGMTKYRQFEDNLQTLCEVPMSKWPSGFKPQDVYQGAVWFRKAAPAIRNHLETLTKRLTTAAGRTGTKRATGRGGRAKVQTRGTKRAAHAATG
jgi:hypothetical protein